MASSALNTHNAGCQSQHQSLDARCTHAHPGSNQQEDHEDILEQQALGKIIFALRQYSKSTEQEVSRWEHNYRALSARHRAILSHLPAKAAAARRAIQQNQLFIKAILLSFAGQLQEDDQSGGGGVPDGLVAGALAYADQLEAAGERCTPGDAEKVRYVLKNLVRDWAAEGAIERQQCFGRLINQLKLCFGNWSGDAPPRVLLPGAGLGRLCVEVAAAGFEAQGNEFSYFMLLTAAFLLNSTGAAEQWTVHPWVHLTCNNVTNEDQLRGVTVPDVLPSSITPPGMLSMCAGDFVEVYSRPAAAGSFDAVVTCFFIDTAHNVLEYLEVIHHVLRPGGYWIHLGPLLWHWADGHWDELSVELSMEDIQQAAQLMGFKLLQHEFVDAAYIANIRSMYKTVYQAAFWTMQKTDQQLPEDLNELLKVLAVVKQQQQQQQASQQMTATQHQAGHNQQVAQQVQQQEQQSLSPPSSAGTGVAADARQQEQQQG